MSWSRDALTYLLSHCAGQEEATETDEGPTITSAEVNYYETLKKN